MAKTAQQVVDKWVRNLGNSTQDYIDGINGVTEAPGAKAAAAADKWLAGIQRAHQTQRFQQSVAAVDLVSWKQAAIQKGAARLASGAEAARSKMMVTTAALLVNVEQVKAIVDAMPDVTFEQRQQRALRWMTEMHNRPIKGQAIA